MTKLAAVLLSAALLSLKTIALAADDPLLSVLKGIDAKLQAGTLSYSSNQRVSSTPDDVLAYDWKVSYSIPKGKYSETHEGLTASRDKMKYHSIVNGDNLQRSLPTTNLSQVLEAKEGDLTSSTLAGAYAIRPGPSICFGRGLSRIKDFKSTKTASGYSVSGRLSDGTTILAEGLSAENEYLPSHISRMDRRGSLMTRWDFSGVVKSKNSPSIPRDGNYSVFSEGKKKDIGLNYTVKSASFEAPPDTEFNFDWHQIGTQLDDMRLGRPVHYLTKNLVDKDGHPKSLDEILVSTKAKLLEEEKLEKQNQQNKKQFDNQEDWRRYVKYSSVTALLILIPVTLVIRLRRRRKGSSPA